MVTGMLLQAVLVPATTLILGLAVILFCPLDPTRKLYPLLARSWSRVIFLAARVSLEVEGLDRLYRDGPVVLVSNHVSLFDPPALLLALPRTLHFIAKRSLFFIPLFGQAIWAAGMIPIDRGDRKRAVASMDRAAERVRRGASVLLFAEGTRSPDGRLKTFKKGAFILAIQASVPIQPLAIVGSREVLPKGRWFARPGTVTVRILEPVSTAGLTFSDRDRLRDTVAARLQEGLEPPTDSPAPSRAVITTTSGS